MPAALAALAALFGRRVPVGWVVVAVLFGLWLTGWLLAR
jgi:hypothetical protein